MKNIVIIGGGTGTFTLLSGLRQFPTNNSVIVSTADDGGSTGRLRAELGVIPPGDIRQCLVGLSYTEKPLRDLFSYRFHQGSLSGHTAGNIILAALEKILGSSEEAIRVAAKLLNVRGEVVPVTTYPTILSAVLANGKRIKGEHHIDEPQQKRESRIKHLELRPNGRANPRALALLDKADAIIFGPGDLFTSTMPNLLVRGVREAVARSRAKKVLVTNIMTKYGQTDKFKVSDFLQVLEDHLGVPLDTVIVNTQKPAPGIAKHYRKAKAEMVRADLDALKNRRLKVVTRPLISKIKQPGVKGDGLRRSTLRHDSLKLAKIIWELL